MPRVLGRHRVPKVPKVPKVPGVLALAVALLAISSACAAEPTVTRFTAKGRAEILATVTVRCDACAWDVVGREAVVLRVTLDGRYVQHLPVVRTGRADYRVFLGPVEPGSHAVAVDIDPALTARDLRGADAAVESIVVDQVIEGSTAHRVLALAPFVYARPDTVGHFTDVPVFMWYEIEPTARGTRYRYSVVFTNEDGGTPADRLMATWGRTTDIEYLYSVEVDDSGAILADDIQGPEHEILPFTGRREGRHPLLWVVTENNMVLGTGTTAIRYAPAPVAFPLREVSREAVMDAHPWLYRIAALELAREGKIVPDAHPGSRTIADPRRFVYLEGCGEVGGLALAFAVRVGNDWISSDRGLDTHRIVRDGCFRGAVPLPPPLTVADVRAVRVQVFRRAGKAGATQGRLTHLNRLFSLDDHWVPGPSRLGWRGDAPLDPDAPPLEIPVP